MPFSLLTRFGGFFFARLTPAWLTMPGFFFTLIQRDAITACLSRFLVGGLCGYRVSYKNGVTA